jgi:hypothetical protein
MVRSEGQVASEGDVFLIPIGDGDYALGQIAGSWNDELYLVVFEIRTGQSEARPDLVAGAEPFLAALSLDAKLWNGDWPIIGNFRDNLGGIAEPMFRVMQNGAPYVESRDRSIYRPARGNEFARLQFRAIASPAVVEDAVKARFGFEKWLPGYDRYLYGYVLNSQLEDG